MSRLRCQFTSCRDVGGKCVGFRPHAWPRLTATVFEERAGSGVPTPYALTSVDLLRGGPWVRGVGWRAGYQQTIVYSSSKNDEVQDTPEGAAGGSLFRSPTS